MGWDGEQPGVMRLPSGRVVRGRGLRKTEPVAGLETPWQKRYVRRFTV